MIYDAARARVLLFGGRGASAPLNDTWTWDGSRWTRVATTGPSPRLEPLLTYDSNRQRVVLVGGIDAAFNRIRDMWEWDGTTWTQLTAPSLPALQHASLGYDPTRQRVVLFGGTTSAQLGETWEWNGQLWERKATTVPTMRELPAHPLIYAPGRQTLLAVVANMSAGTAGQRPHDLWEWNGTVWQVVNTSGPGVSPPPLWFSPDGAALFALDLEAPRMLQGNAQGWTALTATTPGTRSFAALAYDAARNQAVLFGGQTASALFADTWVWNGTTWMVRPG